MKFHWETEFKETEIGEIPRDWEVRELRTLVIDIIKGRTPRKIYGNVPYLSAKYLRGEEEPEGYYEENAGILADKSDIIILWDGSNAGEIFKGEKGLLASTMCKFVFEKNIEKNFLYFGLKLNEDKLKDAKSGTDDRHVDKDYLLAISIPYPPLPEQNRIATVLSYFDDLIENKKRQNEILEKTAMAIFKNWFIDFEPFKDGEFVDSELGKIPKGWEVKRLGEITIGFKGVSYNSPDTCSEPQGDIFITLNNFIRGGGFKTEYIYYIGNRAKEQHKVKEGDLIIALTDITYEAKVVGAPAFVFLPEEYDFGIISLDCMKLQPNYEYLKLYLYLHLKQTQEENSTFANGVNVLHLNVRLFMQNKIIVLPPPPILQKFHSLVEPLFQKIIFNQKQIMLLRKIRDKLLPLLVFGKLRVEEV
ncbi:MAG: restriction endonuclease subunit S [Candidatus Omnitrophica bacterium]|nr:restriction endonuclease subunit S [Candidatus Omnitrophota bacterium]